MHRMFGISGHFSSRIAVITILSLLSQLDYIKLQKQILYFQIKYAT